MVVMTMMIRNANIPRNPLGDLPCGHVVPAKDRQSNKFWNETSDDRINKRTRIQGPAGTIRREEKG